MKKILTLITLMLTLSSCSFFHIHKMTIEQGNILTQESVSKIHTGMTVGEVKNILGEPVLLNTFADNRIDYVYTYKPGYGDQTEKYLTLTFQGGRLKEIGGNMYSAYMR